MSLFYVRVITCDGLYFNVQSSRSAHIHSIIPTCITTCVKQKRMLELSFLTNVVGSIACLDHGSATVQAIGLVQYWTLYTQAAIKISQMCNLAGNNFARKSLPQALLVAMSDGQRSVFCLMDMSTENVNLHHT